MPELPEVEAWRRALDGPVSAFPIEKAGPAHVATLKTFDPPLRALEGRRFAGAERRGKRLLFPTDDGELVLLVHLMSAGRLRYLGPARRARRSPAFRLRFEGGGELVLTEAGSKKRAGVWLLTPEAAEAELAHLGPEALGLGAERLGEILAARVAPAAPAAARPARDRRASAARGRTRSCTRRGSRPSSSRPSSHAEEVERLAAAIDEELDPRPRRSASAARKDAKVYRVHNRLGEPCHVCGDADRSASTTRSTRSTTARSARPAAGCSRTAGSRGCCASGASDDSGQPTTGRSTVDDLAAERAHEPSRRPPAPRSLQSSPSTTGADAGVTGDRISDAAPSTASSTRSRPPWRAARRGRAAASAALERPIDVDLHRRRPSPTRSSPAAPRPPRELERVDLASVGLVAAALDPRGERRAASSSVAHLLAPRPSIISDVARLGLAELVVARRASARSRTRSRAACAGRGRRARRAGRSRCRRARDRGSSHDERPPTTSSHDDLQASPPEVRLGLSRAGVTGVAKAIRIRARGRREKLIAARDRLHGRPRPRRRRACTCRASRSSSSEAIDEVVIGEALLVEELAEHIARHIVDAAGRACAPRCGSPRATRCGARRRSPACDAGDGRADRDRGRLASAACGGVVGVEATGINACPCAQGLVRGRAAERLLEAGFGERDVERILELVPLATHNQRGRGTLYVGTAQRR